MESPVQVPQSVLAPASDGAALIGQISWELFTGAAVLLVLVIALLVYGVRQGPRPTRSLIWLVGGGLVLPGIVLTVLLARGLTAGTALAHTAQLQGLEVEVIARRWWWELRYRDPEGGAQVVLANELHLPLDCAAVLQFRSEDVIHSFWVPALAGKIDVIPGRRTQLVIHATKPGRYRGQCAEYCGTQHANMGLEVVVQTPEAFRAWLLNEARPAQPPVDAAGQRGLQVFHESGCGACHAIRGTDAAGTLGPDLTHVAGRRELAAATLVNDLQSMQHWIRSPQHVKPGNLMPAMPIDDASLAALSAYLAGLD